MGGGGGDGGAAKRQAAIEAKKDAARKQLNYLFGEGTPADMVSRGQYEKTVDLTVPWDTDRGERRRKIGTTTVFDKAGYDAAVKAAGTTNPNKEAREALYTDVRNNAYNAGKRELDENRDKAKRGTKFALFAQGLNGGSEDIDQNALLDRTYNDGLLQLGAKADSARADFRTSDENTRLNLLQAIEAGTDQQSAISSALNQMKNNSDRAAAEATGTSLGDLFATSGALYTQSQAAKGKQAAADWWNQFAGGGKAAKGATQGIVTQTG